MGREVALEVPGSVGRRGEAWGCVRRRGKSREAWEVDRGVGEMGLMGVGFENFVLFLSFIHMPGMAKVLSAKEIQNILKVLISPRDKLLFATGLYTGLRISEIIAIKQKHACTTNDGMRNILKITRQKRNTVYSDIQIHPKLRK